MAWEVPKWPHLWSSANEGNLGGWSVQNPEKGQEWMPESPVLTAAGGSLKPVQGVPLGTRSIPGLNPSHPPLGPWAALTTMQLHPLGSSLPMREGHVGQEAPVVGHWAVLRLTKTKITLGSLLSAGKSPPSQDIANHVFALLLDIPRDCPLFSSWNISLLESIGIFYFVFLFNGGPHKLQECNDSFGLLWHLRLVPGPH